MHTRFHLTAIGLLALASCGGAGGETVQEEEAISSEELAERSRDAVKPEPGLYRTTVEVIEVDIPGAPPALADRMGEAMGGRSHEYCLSQEDVDRGYEEMVRQSQQGECEYARFDVDGGQIDAQMSCTADGGTMNMTMTGDVTPTSSEMEMVMKTDIPGMGQSVIRTHSSTERIGDCAG